MNKPVYFLLGCVCIAVILSAGCASLTNPTPDQVKVHGNIIIMDPTYVDNNFIWSLLLNPNTYDAELIREIDNWLDPKNPVIEVGAGVGVLSAYMNDMLILPTQQVSVEPNPYLIPSLEKTKTINALGYSLVAKAVSYGSPNVTMSVGSSITQNKIMDGSMFVETITVPATTVQKIADDARFTGNITLVMNIVGYEHDVIQHEAEFLRNNVTTVISAVYTDGKNTPDTFSARMNHLGFTERERQTDTNGGYVAMAFQKTAVSAA